MGVDILNLIWIWSMVFGITHIPKLGSLSWFWRWKEHPYPLSPDLGLWRILSGVWNLDLALNMITSLWFTNVLSFGSLSCFWGCKEHQCPLSTHLWLWGTLEVPDWGWSSWSWFGYDQWSLLDPSSHFWPVILILKVQRTLMSFESLFWPLEDTKGSNFGSLSWL